MKGLYPFELFKFYDFFQELSQFSMTLHLAFLFKNFRNFLIFGDFFHLTQFNRHKLWYIHQQVCHSYILLGGFHAMLGDRNNNGEMNKCWWTNKVS